MFRAGDGVEGANGLSVEYDSRAMRKVEDQQDFIAVIEASAQSLGCVVFHAARILVKLH